MKPFTFRAEAALELRRRQEEEARRVLAAAEARLAEAQEQLALVLARFEDALQRAREEEARPGPVAGRVWYRNWMIAHRQRADRCQAMVTAREAEVAAARAAAALARRKVRALERLKERAWRAYCAAERRDEQKALDALGNQRYAVARATGGDST
jgi:flagellar export protein FliJ